MTFAKFTITAALALAALPATLHAQDAATASTAVQAGETVYGPDGQEVGKIEKVGDGNVVVNTGTQSATVAATAVSKGEKGLTITMTRDQLNAAIEAAAAKSTAARDAALVAGAAVKSADGSDLGTIKAISAEGLVEVSREGGSFSLKKDLFSAGDGAVVVGLTAQQVDEALAKPAN